MRPVRPTSDHLGAAVNTNQIKNAPVNAIVRDDQVAGLHLRVFEKKRSFYLYFRTKTGLERRPKIGDFPTITLDQARKVAREMLFEVARGNDPMADRRLAKEAPTVDEALTKYLKEHSPTKKTGDQDEWMAAKYVPASLRAKRVADVKYQDIQDFHQSMKDTPFQANRVKAMLSKMFVLCERWDYRPLGSNPCQHVANFREPPRRRYMTSEETSRIVAELHEWKHKRPKEVAHIFLLLLTGARMSEIGNAKWGQLQGNKLVLAEHKTDQKGHHRVIHLPAQAMEVIDELPRLSDEHPILGGSNLSAFWRRARVRAQCPDLRINDLRHSFASMAVTGGLSLAAIGELLGHNSSATTKRYAHLMDDAASAAADVIGDAIMSRATRQTETT